MISVLPEPPAPLRFVTVRSGIRPSTNHCRSGTVLPCQSRGSITGRGLAYLTCAFAHLNGLPKGGAGYGNISKSKPSLCPIRAVRMSREKGIDVDICTPERHARVAMVKIHCQILRTLQLHFVRPVFRQGDSHTRAEFLYCVEIQHAAMLAKQRPTISGKTS